MEKIADKEISNIGAWHKKQNTREKYEGGNWRRAYSFWSVWLLIGSLRFQLLWSCSSLCSCEGEPVIAAMLAMSLAPGAVEIERDKLRV